MLALAVLVCVLIEETVGGEYCEFYSGDYYCDGYCCGSINFKECCDYTWIIVGGAAGGIVALSFFILFILVICNASKSGQRRRAVQPHPMLNAHVVALSSNSTTYRGPPTGAYPGPPTGAYPGPSTGAYPGLSTGVYPPPYNPPPNGSTNSPWFPPTAGQRQPQYPPPPNGHLPPIQMKGQPWGPGANGTGGQQQGGGTLTDPALSAPATYVPPPTGSPFTQAAAAPLPQAAAAGVPQGAPTTASQAAPAATLQEPPVTAPASSPGDTVVQPNAPPPYTAS